MFKKQEPWDDICSDAVIRMSDHIKPFLSPISKMLSDIEGEHLGTGSYIELDGKKFLITNEHVARYSKFSFLTNKFFENEKIVKIAAPFCTAPAPIDVAFCEISNHIWSLFDHSALAIPSSRFADRHSPVDGELLFFCGYSGEKSKFLFEHLFTKGTPYLTQECPLPQKVKEAEQEFHFSLLYSPNRAISVDGTSSLPDPHGFSGSLVWDTQRIACLNEGREWCPEMAKVTGIVWGWPSSEACILATKIEHVINVLKFSSSIE